MAGNRAGPRLRSGAAALGYVRVGALWVDGRRVVERSREGQKAEDAAQADPERLARAIQSQWFLRLARSSNPCWAARSTGWCRRAGRILEIRDPLAILPLAQVLSEGDASCRALLVEALSQFPEDEATLNLAVAGLLDPDADVRAQAAIELARRRDPRVVTQYRAALRSGNDVIVPRAAGAGPAGCHGSGAGFDRRADGGRNEWVEMPVDRYFLEWVTVFTASTVVHLSAGLERHARAADRRGLRAGRLRPGRAGLGRAGGMAVAARHRLPDGGARGPQADHRAELRLRAEAVAALVRGEQAVIRRGVAIGLAAYGRGTR